MTVSAPDRRPRRAIAFTPMETDRALLVEAAVLAERSGYEAVVIPEGWGLDAFVVLAEIAGHTERIRLVAGVASVWGRSAATLAMASATLDDLSGGRFTLGVGASTAALAEGFHDVAFAAPARRLRDTVAAVRQLLDGQRLPASRADRGLRLGQPARPHLPIWVAGLGPRSTRVALDLGDAWFPAMTPLDRLPAIREAVDTARDSNAELVCAPAVAADVDGLPGRMVAEQMVGWYLTGMGPFYGDALGSQGQAEAVAALRAANPRPRPFEVDWPSEDGDLLEQLAVVGSDDDIARGLARWDAEADLVATCLAPAGRESVLRTIEAAAPPR